MQASGRLYTTLSSFKIRRVLSGITGTTVQLNDTSNITADSIYKPFLIQGNLVAQIVSVNSSTEVEIDQDPGFVVGDCFTPWSSRWVHKTGEKATFIRPGDIVVGQDADVFQIMAVRNYGVKTAMLALWKIGKDKEPTAANSIIYTPTSLYHL